jgi:hypothetical protein
MRTGLPKLPFLAANSKIVVPLCEKGTEVIIPEKGTEGKRRKGQGGDFT